MITSDHLPTPEKQITAPLIYLVKKPSVNTMDFRPSGNASAAYDTISASIQNMMSCSISPVIPSTTSADFAALVPSYHPASQRIQPSSPTAPIPSTSTYGIGRQSFDMGTNISSTPADYPKPHVGMNTSAAAARDMDDQQDAAAWARTNKQLSNTAHMRHIDLTMMVPGSGGYSEENSSLVAPCTFYSPIQSSNSPSSVFSSPPNLVLGNSRVIKRRRSSALSLTAVADIKHEPQQQHQPHVPSHCSYQNHQQYYAARAGTMITPMSSSTGTPSPYSFPGSTSSSSSAGPILADQPSSNLQLLRFNIILQASTAVTQISEGSPTTYLNRGQAYAIHLQDTCEQDVTMTSTFIIMFHEPSHRKVALNYWKFWLSQQKNPSVARAVTLDQEQSAGIDNIRFPSFDRVVFDWNGRLGAKISVRFNCLSTDFSRIKGVKGIPLRAQMETKLSPVATTTATTAPPGPIQEHPQEYIEQCYCKIKLFRDKGAERKNKDDAKQIGKHLERVYAEGNPQQHPFWLMYNQPRPYSVMSEIPTTPQQSTSDAQLAAANDDLQVIDMASLFSQQQQQQQQSSEIPNTEQDQRMRSSTDGSQELTPSSLLMQTLPYHTPATNPTLHHKRTYSEFDNTTASDEGLCYDYTTVSPGTSLLPQQESDDGVHNGLSLYINVKTTQHQRFHSPPSPSSRTKTDKKKLQHIVLEKKTVHELIAKLSPILSLHHSQVSEVLWRQPKNVVWDSHSMKVVTKTGCTTKNAHTNSNDTVLVVVNDQVLTEHFINGTVVGIEWEIKSDGTVRLLLQ